MATYKTPGVYLEEISKFPPSVAEVATAIPAFIGYTERAELFGQNLTNIPTRVKTLLEYRQIFGGPYVVPNFEVVLNENNGYAVTSVTPSPKRFYMDEAIRMFFDNGGGPCYIVSVGSYGSTIALGDETATPIVAGLGVGLKAVEKFDEPTILLFPDAPLLGKDAFYTLQQRALSQCGRLMDRVAVLDLKENATKYVEEFRDAIGINNLKYGAAYTPWLFSTYPKDVVLSSFNGEKSAGVRWVKDSTGGNVKLESMPIDPKLNDLVANANTAIAAANVISTKVDALRTTAFPALADRIGSVRRPIYTTDDAGASAALSAYLQMLRDIAKDITGWKASVLAAGTQPPQLVKDIDAIGKDKLGTAIRDLIGLEKNNSVQAKTTGPTVKTDTELDTEYAAYSGLGWLPVDPATGNPLLVTAVGQTTKDYTSDTSTTPATTLGAAATVNQIARDLDKVRDSLLAFIDTVRAAAATRRTIAQDTLYQQHPIIRNIFDAIAKELSRVPPSGAVAGVYAFVDATRGVWKAPANVSLAAVASPTVAYDYYDQEDLNVDVVGGKSINAIRTFTGAGHLIWGARTLAGNDNEWRYVPVRRFFNMVEESVKKSTAWAVFEPNDPNLWTKVKGMIDNYLIQKWRDGALVGSTPDKAFFTHVGLGVTMTAQDVLEGRLIIEIGMAVVRPAEFIILRFMHKMQEV